MRPIVKKPLAYALMAVVMALIYLLAGHTRTKALKLFRALSMAGGLTCFMISCLPDIKGENGYDWIITPSISLLLPL